MKSKIVAIALLASTTMMGYSTTSFAQTCHDVSGSVTTENITSALQLGNMSLMLSDNSGSTVFSETGSLVGNITGADSFGATLLSHKARFPQGDSFVTNDDTAVPNYNEGYYSVRNVDENGTPCSFYIHETISDIPKGTGFFKDVTSVEVFADGYISNCPNENENSFALSGVICVE
jgi:hypothetical protein